MALGAGLSKACRHMVRICGALIVLQVTAHAGRAGQVEIVVHVAVGTLTRWHRMSADERKTCCAMIEVHTEPCICAMAESAVGGEAAGSMVWIAGGLEIRRVAGVAVRRHRLKPAGRSSFVAGIAIHCCMCASQRKAIVVLLHVPNGNLPSENGMTLLTVCSQLALMDVSMAILTALSDVREHGPDVTLGARHGCVHAPKGIFRLVMVEFWNGANRSPRIGGVAVLARYIQIPVRTAGASDDLRTSYARSSAKQKQ